MNKELLNEFARQLYALKGCQVKQGYDFSKATHPEEVLIWNQAVLANDMFNLSEESTNERKER